MCPAVQLKSSFNILRQLVAGADPAVASKALYCAAALARNSPGGAGVLMRLGGLDAAAALLGPEGMPRPVALRRKALSLLADLALADAQARSQLAQSSAFHNTDSGWEMLLADYAFADSQACSQLAHLLFCLILAPSCASLSAMARYACICLVQLHFYAMHTLTKTCITLFANSQRT